MIPILLLIGCACGMFTSAAMLAEGFHIFWLIGLISNAVVFVLVVFTAIKDRR